MHSIFGFFGSKIHVFFIFKPEFYRISWSFFGAKIQICTFFNLSDFFRIEGPKAMTLFKSVKNQGYIKIKTRKEQLNLTVLPSF